MRNELPVLSPSAIAEYQDCKRKYYYHYKMKLERNILHMPFVMGNVIQYGIMLLYKKEKDVLKKVKVFFNNEKQKLRKNLSLNADQEQDLIEHELISQGMIEAYGYHHKEFIAKTKLLDSEVKIDHTTDTYRVKGRIDNALQRQSNRRYLHEVKTTNFINDDYIKSIQHALQTGIYFHTYNETNKEKFYGIAYDIIRKPTIRQKKTESYKGFLKRLSEWYKEKPQSEVFHLEIIEKPIMTRTMVLNVLEGVAKEISQLKNKEDYFQNFGACNKYGRCFYFDLCFYGENKLNLANFKVREY